MGWVTCSRCGFTQIPSERCLRCGNPLPAPPSPAAQAPAPRPAIPRFRRAVLPAILGSAALVLLLLIILHRRGVPSLEAGPGPSGPTPAPWTLDLSGTWSGQTSKLLPGPPPRPVLKEVQIETDAAGDIFAARAVLTDPGRGGAGGGYRIVEDGPRRLRETVQRLAGAGAGAPLELDFIQYPPWIPGRERRWRALEGQRRRSEETRYLLLESVENDYLVQAGINESGFLSYAFFSPQYATGRGTDALSRTIRPDPGSSLRGFRNLVWDLSGSADFVSLRVEASLTGPEGRTDRMELIRETGAVRR